VQMIGRGIGRDVPKLDGALIVHCPELASLLSADLTGRGASGGRVPENTRKSLPEGDDVGRCKRRSPEERGQGRL